MLFVANPTADAISLRSTQELCGFGGGDWLQGIDAHDEMNHVGGQWLPFLASPSMLVVLDQKSTPPHVIGGARFDIGAVLLQELLNVGTPNY